MVHSPQGAYVYKEISGMHQQQPLECCALMSVAVHLLNRGESPLSQLAEVSNSLNHGLDLTCSLTFWPASISPTQPSRPQYGYDMGFVTVSELNLSNHNVETTFTCGLVFLMSVLLELFIVTA